MTAHLHRVSNITSETPFWTDARVRFQPVITVRQNVLEHWSPPLSCPPQQPW
jgi:hypothetical protein